MRKKTHASLYLTGKTFCGFFCSTKKLLSMNRSSVYTSETHQVTPMALRSEQVCTYDLDDMDIRWLKAMNGERAIMGKSGDKICELCTSSVDCPLKRNSDRQSAVLIA